MIQWIRKRLGIDREQMLSVFQKDHYAKFAAALEESDLQVYVYDEHTKGEQIIKQGEDLHPVTPTNLVSFRKLRRNERRYLRHTYKEVYETTETVR